jgi:mono/diheme cytochrome c family protein
MIRSKPLVARLPLILGALAILLAFAAPRLFAGETNIANAPAGPMPDPATVAKGKALYTENCSHCHGFNMVNPGTITYDLRQFPHDQRPRFEESVANGKNGRMPAWGDLLGLEEIDAIWAYVLTGGKS